MPALVLLAGMNCTSDLWSDAGLGPVITPVLDRDDIDEQVEALCAELPQRFVLGGHSLGGIVAMALAAAAPERVSGLCLVSTNAKAPTDAQRDGWREWLAELDGGADARELQSRILPALLGPEAARRPDVVERTLAMGAETGAERLRAQLRMQLSRRDLLGLLPSVHTPTLVVSGLDDVICPPHFHTEIVSSLPDARLVTLDAGHMLPLERAEAFGALVRCWQAQPTDAEAAVTPRH
ncbi:alpha/beta fold hydrolase [Microbacterium hydrocarbonoxydans]|uniref:alpha/beta fold hydrolase n=1 Tax=Microbacterium hydrocarbonoxydans TaxID=273678 RepID=UPI0013DA9F28|nr:alpha/beta hydrolase [Microbacterium hydrocarbonoxydans]